VREIKVNVAYRWFLWLRLTDGVFDASTLSQNRRRRYNDTSVAQDIFDGIVEQAIAHGLVDGMVLYTDSTHLKANADKHRVGAGRRCAGYHFNRGLGLEQDVRSWFSKPFDPPQVAPDFIRSVAPPDERTDTHHRWRPADRTDPGPIPAWALGAELRRGLRRGGGPHPAQPQ